MSAASVAAADDSSYGSGELMEEWSDVAQASPDQPDQAGAKKAELLIDTALLLPLRALHFTDDELATLPAAERAALASAGEFPLRVVSEKIKGIAFQLWPAAKIIAAFMQALQNDPAVANPLPVVLYGKAAAAAAAASAASAAAAAASSSAAAAASCAAAASSLPVSPVPAVPSPPYWAGKRVLELGSGCGLNGVLAAALGATVTLSDMDSVAQHLRANVDVNFGANGAEDSGGDGATSLRAAKALLHARCTVASLDWCAPLPASFPPAGHFDVLLLSDCVYWEDLFAPLVATLRALCTQRTQIFLCQSPRRPKIERRFYKLAEKHFRLELVQSVEAAADSGESNRVQLFSMRLK